MTKDELQAMVADILKTMEPPVKAADYKPTEPVPQPQATCYGDGDFVEDVSALDLRQLYLVDDPKNGDAFRRMKERTPARLGSGRAGARYKTLTMLRCRADHAAYPRSMPRSKICCPCRQSVRTKTNISQDRT